MPSPISTRAATLIGFGAIILWSLLAYLTTASGGMPPFQLMAVTFAIGGLAGVALWPFRPGAIRALRQPPKVWLLGVGGLFGYHFLYFTALRNAPPVEAGLLNYLWPLLIVLFSALLPGEKLSPRHIIGSVLALFGAALIVSGGQGVGVRTEHLFGYAAALAAAFVWSSYSVISRRFASVPTDAVTGFCLVTAALASVCHLLLEPSVWPAAWTEWLAIVALGLGPLGLAFYVWDIGMKRGDIQVVGAASYATPLLSTLILIGAGAASFTLNIAIACILITAGAVIAAWSLLFTKPRQQIP